MSNKIWITWDDHRRSRELSRAIGAEYIVLTSKSLRLIRYMKLSYQTFSVISRKKPDVVFCQNPSLILACFLCSIKPLFRFYLVVDRHSNFKFGTENSSSLKWRAFHFLSDYSLRKADLTIVTNRQLSNVVEKKGGRVTVLPDKIPDFVQPRSNRQLPEKYKFLFICTFSDDEPVTEVLESFKKMGPEYGLYVTGNSSNFRHLERYQNFGNIHFLGFISDVDYVSYLFSCDATIILTSMIMTLNCGSYESIAAQKPQIISGTEVIREYFYKGAYHLQSFDPIEITKGVKAVSNNLRKLKSEIKDLHNEIDRNWRSDFEEMNKVIEARVLFLEKTRSSVS